MIVSDRAAVLYRAAISIVRRRTGDGGAALFVSICRIVGLLKSTRSIENRERLCEAYEIYREWDPTSDLEFEQAAVLLDGAAQGDNIDFRPRIRP